MRAVPCCAYFDLELIGSVRDLEQADLNAAIATWLAALQLKEVAVEQIGTAAGVEALPRENSGRAVHA